MKDFRDLKVWQKAHQLVLRIYRVTATFPNEELYGLRSQMRRSAASIPMNIAEGCGRRGAVELAHFSQIGMGSGCELEYQVVLASDLGLIASPLSQELLGDISEVKRMLTSFIQKLRAEC